LVTGVTGDSVKSEGREVKQREKREALSMLRELWLRGDSSLRRIYSSWEQLEANFDLVLEGEGAVNQMFHACPYCDAKQDVSMPLDGVFPYQKCGSCGQPFFIKGDLTLRKLSDEEKREIPEVWFQIVEDLGKKKVAVVFRLE
jgi:hypothetical protein